MPPNINCVGICWIIVVLCAWSCFTFWTISTGLNEIYIERSITCGSDANLSIWTKTKCATVYGVTAVLSVGCEPQVSWLGSEVINSTDCWYKGNPQCIQDLTVEVVDEMPLEMQIRKCNADISRVKSDGKKLLFIYGPIMLIGQIMLIFTSYFAIMKELGV